MKTKRPNTLETSVTQIDMTDTDKMKAPPSVKVCKRFGPSCQFWKQSVLHPSPQESDCLDEDWSRGLINTQKQTGETNLLSDWDLPKPQSNPDSQPEVVKINMDKLSLEHDNPQEEHMQVTDSLIPPPTMDKEEKTTTQEKTDAETRYQQEEEKYKLQQKIYVGQLSDEESNTSLDYSGYSYFS